MSARRVGPFGRSAPARSAAVVLLLTGLVVTGCSRTGAQEATSQNEPAVVTTVSGSEDQLQIRLTEDGASRIGLTLATVSAATPNATDGPNPTSVAAGAVVYDPNGATWVYVQQQPLTFQRAQVVLSRVAGDTATLRSGPPVGTQVALLGVAELKGAEEGVPGEQ